VFKRRFILVLVGLMPWVVHAQFRDPTQPAYPLPAQLDNSSVDYHVQTELVLSAIGMSSKSKWAIINGVLAKQGETVTIGPKPDLSVQPAPSINSNDSAGNALQNLMTSLSGGSAQHLQQTKSESDGNNTMNAITEMAGPLAGLIGPLVAGAKQSLDVPQLQPQNKSRSDKIFKQEAKSDSALPVQALRSITIKIMAIGKNSVTIDQSGEIKTLQLIRRSYKTTQTPLY
jgi:hypothetical protein